MIIIHFGAVIASALASFILGFLFHGPISGKLWMKLANIHPTGNEKLSDMYGKMGWNFAVNLVTAFVMAIIFALVFSSSLVGSITWYKGAILGALMWLGFLVTSSSINVIWMGQSLKLWLFESICSLIVMTIMGIILVI